MNTYGYDMPGIAKKIEALQADNTRLQHQLRNLQQANVFMADLIYGDGERDTTGFTVAALVNTLRQYANRENWTRDAEIEYSIDDYVESGSVRLDMPIVWKCGSPGYLLAERALNGELSESEGNETV